MGATLPQVVAAIRVHRVWRSVLEGMLDNRPTVVRQSLTSGRLADALLPVVDELARLALKMAGAWAGQPSEAHRGNVTWAEAESMALEMMFQDSEEVPPVRGKQKAAVMAWANGVVENAERLIEKSGSDPR